MMSRILPAVASLFIVLAGPMKALAEDNPPNVLLIMVDELGYYGSE